MTSLRNSYCKEIDQIQTQGVSKRGIYFLFWFFVYNDEVGGNEKEARGTKCAPNESAQKESGPNA